MFDPVFYNNFKYVYQDMDVRVVNNAVPPVKQFDIEAVNKTDKTEKSEKSKKDNEKDKDAAKKKKKDNMFGL